MSASTFRRAAGGLIPILCALQGPAGCVTVPEQVTSATENRRFERLVDSTDADRPDPLEFRPTAEAMVATQLDLKGRVVDTKGRPLSGAIVRAYLFDRLLDPFAFPYFARTTLPERTTKRRGLFRISRVRGAGLYLEVSVPGYVPVSADSRFYFPESPSADRSAEGWDDAGRMRFVFEPAAEERIAVQTGALRLPPEEGVLEATLRGFDPYPPPSGTGDVAIRCSGTAQAPLQREPYAWRCVIEVPDGGGIQPLRLARQQRAPTRGYKQRVTVGYSAKDPDWRSRAARDLILRFPDGTHGVYTLTIRLDGDRYAAFDGAWNPSGDGRLP